MSEPHLTDSFVPLPNERQHQKFAQPTVETCPYRHVSDGDGIMACCELVRRIAGVTEPRRVSLEACHACCQSFPPTVETWNPVVASLVHELADEVTKAGGVSGCSTTKADTLRQKASGVLEFEYPPAHVIRPLRVDRPCYFLGPTPLSELPNDKIAVLECRHPQHTTTSVQQCRSCRDWSATPSVSRFLSLPELVPTPQPRADLSIRSWSVGVVTAPRREATLEWCLDSVVRAGFSRPHLFIDGLVRIPDQHQQLPVTWRERVVGAWSNTYLALMEMLQRDPRADAYLLLQDDAVLYDRANLREYLESALWPGDRPGIASLFCPQPYDKQTPGWHTRKEPWVWGAQAFLFSRTALVDLLSSPEILAHRWTGAYDGRVQVDVIIGQWAAQQGWPVYFPNPSLAQHVGNTSSLWLNARIAGFRRANWFAGDLESPFHREDGMSQFPEDVFPCVPEFAVEYQRRVQLGRERMAERQLVICGLCRNVRHFLPKLAAQIERLGTYFRDYRVVMFENDSTDATVEFLHDWQRRNNRVHVLSERLEKVRHPRVRTAERVKDMALYRNRCRSYLLEHFAEFDNVIVSDMDLAGGWSIDGIANTFGHDDWDFVGSSGLKRVHREQHSDWIQFDAWAFRAANHPQPHDNLEVNSTLFERGEPLVPVWSCFGGLGVYRMEAVKAAEYGGSDCEHVVLHERLRQRGFDRLFLNPSQIVLYSPE